MIYWQKISYETAAILWPYSVCFSVGEIGEFD
jgi:hypothetical protein